MAGTKKGGKKAAKVNKAKYGKDFYSKIGKKGGRIGRNGGFAKRVKCGCALIPDFIHETQQCAGLKGGLKSRIKKKPKDVAERVVQQAVQHENPTCDGSISCGCWDCCCANGMCTHDDSEYIIYD